tara:strand:+ start:1609 stop:1785 length:177 start_codon:yes stop_codon:yes gene_type:complete
MTEKQYKQLYGIFVGVFVLNVAVSLWNIKENHKLRQLQAELTRKQLSDADKKEEKDIV